MYIYFPHTTVQLVIVVLHLSLFLRPPQRGGASAPPWSAVPSRRPPPCPRSTVATCWLPAPLTPLTLLPCPPSETCPRPRGSASSTPTSRPAPTSRGALAACGPFVHACVWLISS